MQITADYQSSEDVLSSPANGISGTYTAATCTLSHSGSKSLAKYQTALR